MTKCVGASVSIVIFSLDDEFDDNYSVLGRRWLFLEYTLMMYDLTRGAIETGSGFEQQIELGAR